MAQPRDRRIWVCYVAVALSFGTAAIHAWVMPEHFREWWGYGTFFLIAALAQGIYGVALLKFARRWLFPVGIAGNVAIIVVYVATRTAGIPFFGPHAGEVEPVKGIDMASKLVELTLFFALAALWLMAPAGPARRPSGLSTGP